MAKKYIKKEYYGEISLYYYLNTIDMYYKIFAFSKYS